MSNSPVSRDERTLAVENASYRLAYLVLSFGLLLSVAVRGLVFNQASWDLLALVILGGGVATFHQGTQQILSRRWAAMAFAAGLVGAIVAIVIGMMIRR